jgi:hypothetical protein
LHTCTWLRTGVGRVSVFTRNTAARAFYERHGCRVIASGDGGDNEEGEPDGTNAWTP